MINVKIDGIDVQVEEGTTILDAAKKVQVKIPTLCKHPDVTATAACGLCVVKMVGSPKTFRACSTPITPFEDGKEYITRDAELVDIRRTVLELILADHPNECFTCGRNNNCELQKLAAEFGIREIPFEQKEVDHSEDDDSTCTIKLEPNKCIKCGRCVEVCQTVQDVHALCFMGRGYDTTISPAGENLSLSDSPCVRCGQCSAHCPTGAIFEHDDTRAVWDILNDDKYYTTVQIAPAVRIALGEAFGLEPGVNLTKKIYAALRRLGFNAVFDTNYTADVTIMEEGSEFISRFTKGTAPLPLITTCCPAWVDYMEKYACDVMENFSTAKSPQQMMGALIKSYYAENEKIDPSIIKSISIMPCTAKKYEIQRDENMKSVSDIQDVDIVLTTREFSRMIKQAGIDLLSLPDEEADSILGQYTGAGTIFGNSGGVMEAALRTAYELVTEKQLENVEFYAVRGIEGVKEAVIDIDGISVKVAVASGLGNVHFLLEKIRAWREAGSNPDTIPWHFIEVMACPGGCIAGGGQPYGVQDTKRIKRIEGLYSDDEQSEFRSSHKNPMVQKLYSEFLGAPLSEKAHHLLHTTYTCRVTYKK